VSRHDVVSSWYPDSPGNLYETETGYHAVLDTNMTQKRLNSAAVEAMQSGEVLWDTEVRGFGVRCRARDCTYLVKTRIGGRQRVLTIGRHGRGAWGAESARREAQRLLGLIRDGRDLATDRDEAKAAPTLDALAARYLAEHSEAHKKPRTQVEDARMLRLHILPALGERKAREIGKAEVARFHSGMQATPVGANRALALLSGIMGWAEKVGERPDGSNPCRHVERFPEKARERLLTAVELARLGDALDHAAEGWTVEAKAEWRRSCAAQAEAMGMVIARRAAWVAGRQPRRDSPEDWRTIAALRLLIFTGARLSEVLTLRWEWIDAATGIARLPDSKTGAKNLYLPPGALAVLDTLPRYAGNPHVLPGERAGASFVGIQKPWQRVRALAALPGVRIHDLRHAFASTAVAAGDSLFIVGKLLGHRQSSTTERYSHLAPDPAKAVADRTGERLRALLTGESGAIVKLPVRRPG
jgi:integrase